MPYVVAGKRTGAILFGVEAGIAVSLLPRYTWRHSDERKNLPQRVPGMIVMVMGMVIIIFFGK